MKKKKMLSLLMSAVVLAAGILTGCSGGGEKTEGDASHLTFGCYNYSDSLDPSTNVNSSWCGVRYGITECLFKFNDEVVAEPAICDSYKISDDNKTWTLHIREGVKFSNGKDVTASAVAASLERLYRETDAEQGGKGNSDPKGYLIYEALTADDEAGTVTIVCEHPTSNLNGILSYPYFSIIDTEEADQGNIIGTGPYKMDSVKTGVSMELSRNENYWDGEVPYDTVTIMFIDDSSTKSMALQRGDVDVVENITTASDVKKLQEDSNYNVSVAAGVRMANSYMNYNGVLSNKTLRQAILMALDRDTMCNVTVSGMYTPGFSVLPSSLDYNYDKLTDPYAYNVEQAKKLLDEAGIVDGDGDGYRELDGKNIDLNYIAYSSRNLNELAQAVAIQLKEIGIKASVNVIDYDTSVGLQQTGQFDLITSNAITVGVGDPEDFLGNFYSKNSNLYGYYQNDEFDKLYEQLQVEFEPENRKEIITQLQQVLIDDAATVVHGYYNSRMFSNAKTVTGAEIATIDYYWLTTDIKPVQ